MDLTKLGETIKAKRKIARITQKDLADITHLDDTYISKIERGCVSYPPSRDAIAVLAQALDIDADYLNILAGHIPHAIKPLVCKFLLNKDARKIMEDNL